MKNAKVAEWYGALKWVRLPVEAWVDLEDLFREIHTAIKTSAYSELKRSGLADWLDMRKKEMAVDFLVRARAIDSSNGPISFEYLCEALFLSYGYELDRSRDYDSKGADSDRVFIQKKSSKTSPFFDESREIHVQVKKHWGTTEKSAVLQLEARVNEDPKRLGIVISAADEFSTQAKDKALELGIILFNGAEFSELFVGQLDRIIETVEAHPNFKT